MKPAQYTLGFLGSEFGRATGAWVGFEGNQPAIAVSFDPASHRTRVDAEKACDVGLGVAGIDTFHGQAPAVFEFESRP
jgi:hypothetical protein